MRLTDSNCEFCFDITDLANALDAAGVYALLNEDSEVMYVGESECMFRRLCEHLTEKNKMPRSCISMVAVLGFEGDRDARLDLEEHYICTLQPRYNFDNKRTRRMRRGLIGSHVDPYRRRELHKHGLATIPDHSIEALYENVDDDIPQSMKAEARYLRWAEGEDDVA